MPENTAAQNVPPVNNESSLARNTAPILAIGTVILTFFMFFYFVNLVSSPSKESLLFCGAAKALTDAETRFSQLSSSKTERADIAKFTEARKERDKLKIQLSVAREAADDAKERRGMIKDFVLYILGVLSSALTTIFGYYFGSSKGSSDKTTALNAIASKTLPPKSPEPAPADVTGGVRGTGGEGTGNNKTAGTLPVAAS